MKIISVQEPKLSIIPGGDPVASEELKPLQDRLQAVQDDVKRWRQEWQEELSRQVAQIRQDMQTQIAAAADPIRQSTARWEERLTTLEKLPRFAEERMLQRIQETVKKELELIPAPVPAAPPAPAEPSPAKNEAWKTELQRKEKALQDLKAEFAKIPLVSASAVIKKEAPVPLLVTPSVVEDRPKIQEPTPSKQEKPDPAIQADTEGFKKHLVQESSYSTSSRSTSLFTKLWLYLNESAIEIPIKNSKNGS